MNARYYLPGLGRFVSADTIVPDATNPQSHNRFSYVYNNPLILIDPSGHIACDSENLPGMDQNACNDGDFYYPDSYYTQAAIMMNPEAMEAVENSIDLTDPANQTFAALMALSDEMSAYVTDWMLNTGGIFAAVFGGDVITDSAEAVSCFSSGNIGCGIIAGGAALIPYLPVGAVNGFFDDIAGAISDCLNSFSAETAVITADGPKPISEIEIGELVLAYNEATGEIGYYPVTHLISHIDEEVVYLTIEGETLVTTADHPFYTVAGEWVEAGDLRLGDDIRMASWATGDVESVYIVSQPQPMYNFTVATAHTYFVGEHQWLVHNQNSPSGPCGRSLSELGHIVQWGYDERGARTLLDSIGAADSNFEELLTRLLDVGVTPEEARWAVDIYRGLVGTMQPNTPVLRAELMDAIADVLEEAYK